MAVVVPIETDRFRIVSNVPDALKAFPAEMNVTKVHCEASFRIHVRQADDYAVGRVFLAGDAAHSHSPVGGRGMNLGIADAADFAARLAEDRLAGYHAARHPEGARIIAFSERARRMVDGAGAVRRSAVAAALMTIAALPPLARFAMRRFVGGAPNPQTAPSRSSRAARSRAKSSPA